MPIARFVKVMLWLVVSAASDSEFPYAVVIPYSTRLSDDWSVVHVIVAEFSVMLQFLQRHLER